MMKLSLTSLVQFALASISLVNGFPASASSTYESKPPLPQQNPARQTDVCIIGGGPVGLATAITLASAPHNYNCIVIESNPDVNSFNPGRAFMYNVNARGRTFTEQFPAIDEKLQSNGVKTDFSKFCVIPSDPNEPLPELAVQISKSLEGRGDGDTTSLNNQDLPSFHEVKGEGKSDTLSAGTKRIIKNAKSTEGKIKTAYWIQRHVLTKLFRDYCLDSVNNEDNSGSIEIISGAQCIDVRPLDQTENAEAGGGVEIVIEDVSTKDASKYQCNLVVGADGYNSKVRDLLSSQESTFKKSSLWDKTPRWKFLVKKFQSPATGLRIKVLQFPPMFPVPDVENREVKTDGSYSYKISSVNKGPKNFISLGILPIADNKIKRSVNVIGRPNHDVWEIKDPNQLQEWFQKAFPRMKFGKDDGILPTEEWERFISEEGTRFPYCQYSNGVALHSIDKKSAVVLVGDALHAYPPDIGQGVNSGLADVVQLGKSLKDVNLSIKTQDDKSKKTSLGDAIKRFEKNRLSETKALVRLARFGAPYQYNQPLFIDKVGKFLWTLNTLIRALLNKASFGLFPKSAILLAQDPSLSFKKVMRRADFGTFCLCAIMAMVLKTLFWHKLIPLLKLIL